METMIIRYNPENAVVRSAIELLKHIKAIKIVNDSRAEYVPNAETLAAAVMSPLDFSRNRSYEHGTKKLR